MGNYSIRDLEVLSGIKAHTLRIWEQRYGIIEPKRTDTNIRLYDDTDLKRILNISLLNQNGYKISKIATMTEQDMSIEVLQLTDKNSKYPDQINALVSCMITLDKELFEKVMSKSILQYGFEKTMIHIIFPFMNKVGMLWLTGAISPSQEHFISHLIRKKIMVALDGQISSKLPSSKTFMLFLPEGEYHELGLLFGSYIIKSRNHKVIYLGQSLLIEHIKDAHSTAKVDYLFSVFTTSMGDFDVSEYLEKLSLTFPDTKILITGYQVVGQDLKVPSNIQIMHKIEDLIDILDNINNPEKSEQNFDSLFF